MKEILYDTYQQKPVVRNAKSRPHLVYRECESGLELKVVVRDEDVEKVLDALKGNLPDEVLNALGIEATGEDLEELCSELMSLGYSCILESFEENGEYCERLEVDLIPQQDYVLVEVSGKKVKTKPYEDVIGFVELEVRRGAVVSLRAAVEEKAVKEVVQSRDPMRKILELYGLDVDLKNFDVISLLSLIESKYDYYSIDIERDGDDYRVYIIL
ncbi:hypothetical protein EYM_04700 [Ignicoccus islandicus DSM 13165]|uniref:Uncharacterized protein n=1 Tax=Ignicoccus islandicus DSM 13165 TaxID=940295 RepID=A0A0U3FSN9_9CREN|nr:hypothetical protein [Ignicoccus islandicus]ALU12512.1 hypothetical protein EYM_04700 [Ignicoccus islandicus DSM 13165]